jgi:hypothetical protein
VKFGMEIWITLATQLLILAYGVGVFKTRVSGMQSDMVQMKSDLKQVKKLIVIWLLGPEIDAELFTDDMDSLKRLVVNRKRGHGTGD